jgi:transcriptional regulator with XRE-family HTH domain
MPDMSRAARKRRTTAESRRKQLGARIRRARRDAGFDSIESFAHALGYSWITVSRYERGVSEITVERLHHVADTLGIPISELVDGEKELPVP